MDGNQETSTNQRFRLSFTRLTPESEPLYPVARYKHRGLPGTVRCVKFGVKSQYQPSSTMSMTKTLRVPRTNNPSPWYESCQKARISRTTTIAEPIRNSVTVNEVGNPSRNSSQMGHDRTTQCCEVAEHGLQGLLTLCMIMHRHREGFGWVL